MVITVKRSEWRRGQSNAESYLLSPDGMKCCIGFFCLQAGMDETTLLGFGAVWQIRKLAREPVRALTDDNFQEAYTLNDHDLMSDAERELQLNVWASKHGHSFVFVD